MHNDREVSGAGRTRLHELDAVRSSLMLLGVVIHAANPYAVTGRWLVHDPEGLPFFDGLVHTIRLFRMPAFFLLSGYFSTMLLRRWSVDAFLRARLLRLGIPLLTTLFTVNLVQAWYLAGRGAAPGELVTRALPEEWWSGRLLGHLWFLVFVLVFCLLAAALAPALRRLAASGALSGLKSSSGVFALVAVAVAAGLAPRVLRHVAPGLEGTVLGLGEPLVLLGYLPFFAGGAALQLEPSALPRFSRPGLGAAAVALAAVVVQLLVGAGDGGWSGLAGRVAELTLVWVIVRFLFALFHLWASDPAPLFGYLADASYTVYLLHHLVVVAVASMLVELRWGAALKFSLVLACASALPLAAHHFLVLRRPLLRFLLNGRQAATLATATAAGHPATPGR